MKKIYDIYIDTKKNINTRDFGQLFLTQLTTRYDGKLIPDRYVRFEPIKNRVDQIGLNGLIEKWPQWLKRVAKPKYDFSCDGLDSYCRDYKYKLVFSIDQSIGDAIISELFADLIDMTEPGYAYAGDSVHINDKTLAIYHDPDGGVRRTSPIKVSDNPTVALPGIFWKTYFSTQMAERFSPEGLRSLDHKITRLPHGILINAYDDCFADGWREENAIVRMLGRNFFFSKPKFYADNGYKPFIDDESMHLSNAFSGSFAGTVAQTRDFDY